MSCESRPLSVADAIKMVDPSGEYERAYFAKRPGSSPAVVVSPSSFVRVDEIGDEERMRRAAAYLKKMPGGVQGQRGSDATFAAASAMVHGFGLSELQALEIMLEIHNPKCEPPWLACDLLHKVEDAKRKAHNQPFGYLLARGQTVEVEIDASDIPVLRASSAGVSAGESVGHQGTDLASLNEEDDDPNQIARGIVSAYRHDAKPTLRFWQSSFYEWQAGRGYWCSVEDDVFDVEEVTPRIRRHFEMTQAKNLDLFNRDIIDKLPKMRKVTGPCRANVIQAIKAMSVVRRSEVETAPAWVNGTTGPNPLEIVAAKNGLVNLPEFLAGSSAAISPATPDFFNLHAVAFDVAASPPPPVNWLKFLDSLWGDDPESIQLLQEWMGYLLTQDNSKQAALLLVGPTRAGKGTIMRMIEALVGSENCCAQSLDGLPTDFGLALLYGKSVCLIEDAKLGKQSDSVSIARVIRNVTGGDSVVINEKNKRAFSARLGTRFVISANDVIPLPDTSGAIANRWRVLQFTKSFEGREVRNLDKVLASELPSIFAWAVQGWGRIRSMSDFTRPASASDAFDSIREAASPMSQFVSECCVLGDGLIAYADNLFAAWKAFCDRQGIKDYGTREAFGRGLRAAIPGTKRVRTRLTGNKLSYKYTNVSIVGDEIQDSVPGLGEFVPGLFPDRNDQPGTRF